MELSPPPFSELPLVSRKAYAVNSLLVGVPQDGLEKILSEIKEEAYELGDVIFEEGDPGDAVFLIAKGSVTISKLGRGGRQEILAYLKEGDFFGEMALIDARRRSAQVSAKEGCVLGRMNAKSWSTLLQLAPEAVFTNFTRTMTSRLRNNNEHFIDEMIRTERLTMLGGTVSAIAHDMNNPISCILGACQLMQMKSKSPIVNEMTEIILKSVDRMSSMTRELLEFSRGTTNLTFVSFSVEELVRDLKEELQYQDNPENFTVELDVRYHGSLKIDPLRVLRLLVTLVSNGRVFWTRDGLVRVAVYEEGEHVVFKVTDTSWEIPAEYFDRIFEPFIKIGKQKGTGLGLALAKAVVEGHRGSISLTSEAGCGSCFTVRLPKESKKLAPLPVSS